MVEGIVEVSEWLRAGGIVFGSLSAAVAMAGVLACLVGREHRAVGLRLAAGGLGCLLLAGGVYAAPRVAGKFVEPAGGLLLIGGGLSCDQELADRLVFDSKYILNAAGMNGVIDGIQSLQSDCGAEDWNPVVYDLVGPGGCRGNSTIGGLDVPPVLQEHPGEVAGGADHVSAKSGGESAYRGADFNNLIVHFSNGYVDRLPNDGALCWMYLGRAQSWYWSNDEGGGRCCR